MIRGMAGASVRWNAFIRCPRSGDSPRNEGQLLGAIERMGHSSSQQH
jgi:hypothetical protein